MEGKLVLIPSLIWVLLLLGQLHGCKSWILKERKALLELKTYLISRSQEGSSVSDSVLTTWTNDDPKSDCSRWEGVGCNRTSGRVIGISIGLTSFKEGGSLLNLSLMRPFEELRYMNLSGVRRQFNGFFDDVEGYQSLRRLKKLEILDLSLNYFNNSIFHYLNAATSLTTLILQDNYMNGPFPIVEVENLTKLELLDLSGNRFNGSVPELSHLKHLKALDLSSNEFSSSIKLQELNLTNLEVLSLAENSFTIPIPIEVVCEMKNLRELNLRENNFVGQVPTCLGSLKKLRVLDLSSNQFSGNLPSTFSNLESLEYLSLLDNNFTSLFSLIPLANLTKLKVLKLSSKSNDMVQVKTESTWEPRFQLSVLVLRSCSLETIPSFLVHQRYLRLVDLSSNRLSGNIPTWLLENNPQLEVLQLQNNSFTSFQMPTLVHNLQVLDFSTNDIGLFPDNVGFALPNLVHMNGSDNKFQGHFPSSIGELKKITFLDLSYNNFSGELPRNFITGCFSLKYLKLSGNKFMGHFFPRGARFTSLDVLRMDNNLFTGKIGVGLLSSTNLSLVDMSNNCLAGALPSWIPKLSHLEFLLLSNNLLQGTMPSSLLLMPFLSYLDLSGNLLSGALPSSHVNSLVPKNLFLHNNNFSGSVPDTLLENVQILDLRNNKLFGSIPKFVYSQDINILLLRGNNLTGSIPRQLCDLSNIRLLDLSDNKLHGFIPSCLNNLSFGRGGEGKRNYIVKAYLKWIFKAEYYKSTFLVEEFQEIYLAYQEIEINFATKQRYDSYTKGSEFSNGILDYMYGMDLSNNCLSGLIPPELGDLSKLRALNLSRNFLSSSIPSSFSNLKDIESLDLSYNMLHGSIPQQLAKLTSLAVFDVSHNNLSGRILQEGQFNTFNEKNYLGNPLLCGPPINRSCEAKMSSEEIYNGEEDEDVIDITVFYYSTASGYVAALIGVLVIMCFDCRWRRAWLGIVDAFIASMKRMLP